ncbi:MAG: hypothetical protein ABF302_05785 [Polaribacter sp.]|jgi:hypothetical protein
MSKYKATSFIITLGKIFYWIVFLFSILFVIVGISGELDDFGVSFLVGIGVFLYGILIMFTVELLSIFRDIAVNTQKTYELLEKKE